MLKVQKQHVLAIIGRMSAEPLNLFLKKYFRQNPKLGARDRKIISSTVYNFYRTGKALEHLSDEQRLEFAQHIFSDASLNNPQKKIEFLKTTVKGFDENKIFPFAGYLSPLVEKEKFIYSFLEQPLVWIRIRKSFLEKVYKELNNKEIIIERKENLICPGFASATKLTKLLSFENGFFEIQDASSQQTLNDIVANDNELWWDCCAGSGGKSLLFKDKFPKTQILISDCRSAILENAKLRLCKVDEKNFEIKNIDLLSPDTELLSHNLYNGIIADVPCSGSGTWARTPEMLCKFDAKEIEKYAQLQKKIVSSAIPFLKKGGVLFYITCSVFINENEAVIDFVKNNFNINVLSAKYITGYEKRADTLFVSQLIKSA